MEKLVVQSKRIERAITAKTIEPMKSIWISLVLIAVCTQCAIDRTVMPLNKVELETLALFKKLEPKHQVTVSTKNEPGQRLWLCLTFISKESKEPLNNQKVSLYHTSTAGEYEPSDPNNEATARLSGSVYTDKKGQAFVQTILPGDYGSSADNRHIHTTVVGARPEAYDIHFEQFTGQMGTNFISGSDQHFLANLKQANDSTLVTFLTIEVKKPSSTIKN